MDGTGELDATDEASAGESRYTMRACCDPLAATYVFWLLTGVLRTFEEFHGRWRGHAKNRQNSIRAKNVS